MMTKWKRFFLIWMLSVAGAPGICQDPGRIVPGEEIQLFSGRNLYVAGEKVEFSAFLINQTAAGPDILSRVLYAELIAPDGRRLAGGKYKVRNSASGGCLTIPEDIISGWYYLRAYTKLMRNPGAVSYDYVPLKIVNPYRLEVQAGNDPADKVLNSPGSGRENKPVPALLNTDKKEYSTRETITIAFQGRAGFTDSLKGICLSVVPEASQLNTVESLPVKTTSSAGSFFFPETRGISLTGRAVDKKTGNPVSNSRIDLSLIADKDFMAVRTDPDGRFFFSLPDMTGNRDLFLSSANTEGIDCNLLVDNDFCPNAVQLPAPVFDLTAEEHKTAFDLAVNASVARRFRQGTPADTVISPGLAFYGNPASTLWIDKYIQLPTLEEYFNELPSPIKVRKRHGLQYFRFNSDKPEMTIYDPLVLIDGVAVNDPAKILAVSPLNILKVEIINTPYVKGDMTFGGIISFISRKGDFAGIDLPSSGVFFNYGFFSDDTGCDPVQASSITEPDPRNTLLWIPELKVQPGKMIEISLKAGDTPGRYMVVLRGVTVQGKVFSLRQAFEVKK